MGATVGAEKQGLGLLAGVSDKSYSAVQRSGQKQR